MYPADKNNGFDTVFIGLLDYLPDKTSNPDPDLMLMVIFNSYAFTIYQ